MPSLLDSLKADLIRALQLLGLIRSRMNQDKIYNTALSLIGYDASPRNEAPDMYACAETVSSIVRKALPELRFPVITGTSELFDYLDRSPSFTRVISPEHGDIIISPTGTGNGVLPHGHTGIIGNNTSPDGSLWIMSNDSRTGTLEVNFTLDSWHRFYGTRGGYPVFIFRVD